MAYPYNKRYPFSAKFKLTDMGPDASYRISERCIDCGSISSDNTNPVPGKEDSWLCDGCLRERKRLEGK